MGLLDGLIGLGGSVLSFKMQEKLQKEQQAWAEKMADSVYQRGVADAKAAGLNPIITAGRPDPVPAGSQLPQAPNFGQAFLEGKATSAKASHDTAAGEKDSASVPAAKAQAGAVKAQEMKSLADVATAGTQQQLNLSSAHKADVDAINSQRLTPAQVKEMNARSTRDYSEAKLSSAKAVTEGIQQQLGTQQLDTNEPEAMIQSDRTKMFSQHPQLLHGASSARSVSEPIGQILHSIK